MNIAYERPWYRQFWVWFVIAIPALAIFFSLQFVYIAVVNRDTVVRDDWYEDGKAVNKSFAREEQAARLGLAATVRLDPETGDISLHLDGQVPDDLEQLPLDFVHSTRQALDQRLVVYRIADREFRGQLKRPLEGRFNIELGTDTWRLAGTRQLPDGEGFRLSAE